MISAKTLVAVALLLAAVLERIDAHTNIRGGNEMAIVLSVNTPEKTVTSDAMCDDTARGGCRMNRNLVQKEVGGIQASSPEFIPTYEWQDILPGQAIPPSLDNHINSFRFIALQGLHIRVNLQSGKKEAKLLD
ncbi:hypothetical protein BBO99_00000943 [Phytophthora kernoviae]|uniref:Uncharacterized protein n=2 Tax=Phytophthora kernoviae TaxID=325452 RepID=A0A3R7IMQ1_9STRA|nr:hypothetical protein G195_002400 [Phytophthora kernoviae 00238/432]KAG2531701.1 hypothetical protein JM16_000727 [Phytophthora kernoviae]KAG2533010.1 hypothetical protein JM18_000809 [Phytophthora kernoviae]RLN37706.1 hypothetical protein BBI17_000845 [Phytophthora kernoviae]RLN84946.1 hypothetical protein BBO99_00000943 [Phytophthora kernoviae]